MRRSLIPISGLAALVTCAFVASPAMAGAVDTETHEEVSMPAGKAVGANREVNRARVRMIACPMDASKAPGCHSRQADLRRERREEGLEED